MTNGYLAGLFDGEGNVRTLRPTGRSVTITISQKRPEVLYAVRDHLGYGRVHTRADGCSIWQITRKEFVQDFINRVIIHTIVKRTELLAAQDRLEKVRTYRHK